MHSVYPHGWLAVDRVHTVNVGAGMELCASFVLVVSATLTLLFVPGAGGKGVCGIC